MATLAPEAAITPLPRRTKSDYETIARDLLAIWPPFRSSALREAALASPEVAEVLLGTADAMDAMAVT